MPPKIPFFVRLPANTVLEIKRRARRYGVSEAMVVQDAVTLAAFIRAESTWERAARLMKTSPNFSAQAVTGGPRRKARGGK